MGSHLGDGPADGARRRFLATALLGTTAACARRSAPAADSRHALPDAPRPPETSAVAVVPAAAFASLRAAVAEAIRLAGGLAFVRPGDSVLLKPALNSANRYPATTDPEVVSLVAERVLEAGGRPFVADRTMFLRSTRAAMERTGMADAARAAGIPCLDLDGAPAVPLRHPLAEHWAGHAVRIYRAAAEADHVIQLCTPRAHRLAGFTMAMKNAVGVVDGAARPRMHVGRGFEERLAEISLVLRPELVLLDAREGFADGGPDAGDRCRPGFIAAGSDPLAMDAVGLAMLRVVGTNEVLGRGSIWRLPVMRRAAEIGVGAGAADRIRIVGLGEEEARRLLREMA